MNYMNAHDILTQRGYQPQIRTAMLTKAGEYPEEIFLEELKAAKHHSHVALISADFLAYPYRTRSRGIYEHPQQGDDVVVYSKVKAARNVILDSDPEVVVGLDIIPQRRPFHIKDYARQNRVTLRDASTHFLDLAIQMGAGMYDRPLIIPYFVAAHTCDKSIIDETAHLIFDKSDTRLHSHPHLSDLEDLF